MSIKRWVINSLDKEAAAQLSEDCEINPFLALLLITRGITDAESAAEFLLNSEISDDPFSFIDMDLAVDRIQRALDENEMIAVYGDYDADGVTATVLLYSYLREKDANAVYYIPDRESEGYGLHLESLDHLNRQGVKLIITVDNGISAKEEIEYAKQLGMDVVVTDHHQPPDALPEAVAVVDPHRKDCRSEYKDYAGVGVAFKLICAIEGDVDSVFEKYGDLVALGTLGDVMPLNGENRVLVREGIKLLKEGRRAGVQALCRKAGINPQKIGSVSVSFALVPRINAAGRMDSPDLAARLLMTSESEIADTLAEQMNDSNIQRQKVEADILREVNDRLQMNPVLLADRVLILDGADWHPGVIGIIAARIVERYGKPCIIISTTDGIGKGSGRSISGFSLYEAVSFCSDVLTKFGGHELAAGLSLKTALIDEFRLRINEYAAKYYPDMPVPELCMDFKLRPSQIDMEKINLISALEPMGAGNPQPIFGLFGMRLDNIMPIGRGKHLRLSVSRDGVRLSAIRFNTTYECFPYECGQIMNLVVTLERNEYKGVVTPTILIRDIRLADTKQEELLYAIRSCESVLRKDEISLEDASQWMPNREQLERTYRFMRSKKCWSGALEQLRYLINEPVIPFVNLLFSLEILRQAGLLEIQDKGGIIEIVLLPADGKADITMTPVWQHLNKSAQI